MQIAWHSHRFLIILIFITQISILDTMRRAYELELRYEVDLLKQSIGTTTTKTATDKNNVEELREIIDALQVGNYRETNKK